MTGQVAIKDVAAAARVSTKTVSRVLNGSARSTRPCGVGSRRPSPALDYVPSPAARSLRTGTGSLVGVVVDAIDDPFFSELVSGVEDKAIEFGLDVVVASTRCDARRERQQLQRLLSQRAKGVILAPAGDDDSFLQEYRSSTPVVTVDRAVTGIDSVTVDDRSQCSRGRAPPRGGRAPPDRPARVRPAVRDVTSTARRLPRRASGGRTATADDSPCSRGSLCRRRCPAWH